MTFKLSNIPSGAPSIVSIDPLADILKYQLKPAAKAKVPWPAGARGATHVCLSGLGGDQEPYPAFDVCQDVIMPFTSRSQTVRPVKTLSVGVMSPSKPTLISSTFPFVSVV